MIEKGKVVNINPGFIQVKIERASHCAECNLCSVMGEGGMLLQLPFQDNIRENDEVEIEIPDVSLIKFSIILFIFPIISFAIGVIFSELFSIKILGVDFSEGYQLLVGLCFMICSFFILYFYNNRINKKENIKPRIIRVLQ
ncbi:MAG: hypothetical protein A2161_17370 [Candidatus Schekmanbacteria bacterium RBG_13_48_7]|uniref:Fis family transcriptional regulator n=1 Tax=Candidatus Schekmanbacteria bacterium RBG_13_48_7 TaxID=1817878 RepID=A0A1F7RXA4_9BACT|nr:MAG: hypothetical protein A2161_17370 [Candidatus Schekmanbacteria bacterium RBG_13_48_7]